MAAFQHFNRNLPDRTRRQSCRSVRDGNAPIQDDQQSLWPFWKAPIRFPIPIGPAKDWKRLDVPQTLMADWGWRGPFLLPTVPTHRRSNTQSLKTGCCVHLIMRLLRIQQLSIAEQGKQYQADRGANKHCKCHVFARSIAVVGEKLGQLVDHKSPE